ncbi:hypothetical protein PM082_001820 [Marasmius tenuissimus]|nr:hypothetical protein PM082_001820 [Marasmius tenuissimus]
MVSVGVTGANYHHTLSTTNTITPDSLGRDVIEVIFVHSAQCRPLLAEGGKGLGNGSEVHLTGWAGTKVKQKIR